MSITDEELAEILKNPDLKVDKTILAAGEPSASPVQPSKRGGKYHVSAKEDRTLNGIVYASKKEMNQAQELDALLKLDGISFYLRQVPFTLPGGIVYRADFLVFTACRQPHAQTQWLVQVIETKGFKTPEWKMKLKLFKVAYPNLEIVVD